MKTSKAFQIRTKYVKINEKEIDYLWVKEFLIVPKQFINILGEQNVDRDGDQDRNGCINDEGVEMTFIVDEVFEDESD